MPRFQSFFRFGIILYWPNLTISSIRVKSLRQEDIMINQGFLINKGKDSRFKKQFRSITSKKLSALLNYCLISIRQSLREARTEGCTHGLSQQGVWVPFWTPKPLKRTPQDTQIFECGISKNLNLKLIIELFHLLIIPMTLFNDVMPYFDEFIHVYG